MLAKGMIVACACATVFAAAAVRAEVETAEQARAEVQRAQRAVQAAVERRALWTTAQEALVAAQAALVRGDYAAAVQAARFAAEQAQLGIAQSGMPRFP